MPSHKKRQPLPRKGQQTKPTIVIPPTPSSATAKPSVPSDQPLTRRGSQSSVASPFQTPPTSPSPSSKDLESEALPEEQPQLPLEAQPPEEQPQLPLEAQPPEEQPQLSLEAQPPKELQQPGILQPSVELRAPKRTIANESINANDIMSKDIVAIADLFSAMKNALVTMTNAFDRLGSQTEQMVSLSLDIKAAEQFKRVQTTLDDQISRQKVEIEDLRGTLENKIKDAVQEKIRTQLYDMVKESITQKIEAKVRDELAIQIPEDLREQVLSHRRQILEVKTNLHNSEARRYNASLQSSSNAPLRPLLRPLPTPEQSPAVALTKSTSMDSSLLGSPMSAFPRVPAPTPIKRSTSNLYRGVHVLETVPPTPSPLFPRDLKSLFKLGAGDARALLQQYGLISAVSSPSTERPKHRGLSNVNEEDITSALDSHTEVVDDDEVAAAGYAEDMNKFMAHIGVPFLMIPPPKSKDDQSPALSPTSRRRMLAPLIINAGPSLY
ncbi:hypothetical protein B0H34DRAFT_372103 [Crassisporium funariophilum]|nr:hypothetical protein B0H34DRAFT_372103 [Crassisporium funariophilum]